MTRRRLAHRRADAGFTLVESVVATTLFGVFAASLLTFVMGTFRLTVETQRRVTATHLATEQIADARALVALPVAQAGAVGVTPSIDPTFLDDESVVQVGGVPYEVTRTARPSREAEGEPACVAASSGTGMPAAVVDVVVEVSWPTGAAPVRLVQQEVLSERAFVAVRVHDGQLPVAGAQVGLLSAAQRTGTTPHAQWESTDADGCVVLEVDPAADPAPHHWYTVRAGDAASDATQHVTAGGRYSTPAAYLGRAEAGVVRTAAVEVRREGTVRMVVVDDHGHALTGADTGHLALSLAAADGLVGAGVQVREVGEVEAAPVADDHTQVSWSYPMRSRDLVPADVWWEDVVGLPQAPVITLHPADREVAVGEPLTFEVAATGDEPMHVLWQVSVDEGLTWTDFAADDELWELELPDDVDGLDGLRVRAVVANSVGHAVSGTATVRAPTMVEGGDEGGVEPGETEVTPAPLAPAITAPPSDQAAQAGDVLTFDVAAEGDEPLHVRWQRSTDVGLTWTDVDAGIGMWTWSTPALTPGEHGTWYRAVVSNAAGTAISSAATVSLFSGPRELTLRALWPTDYALWSGSRPGSLASVTVPPGGTVDVLLSLSRGVVAVRTADGTVTVAPAGAG
jgi:prepilin-type N-terminal cleavage/methylation domain-containing protein